MIKKLSILIILLLCSCSFGCGSSPKAKQDVIRETYPNCDILYQKNINKETNNDFFLILDDTKLKIVTVRVTGSITKLITSESIIYGFEVKEKKGDEIIKDLQNVINKYGK